MVDQTLSFSSARWESGVLLETLLLTVPGKVAGIGSFCRGWTGACIFLLVVLLLVVQPLKGLPGKDFGVALKAEGPEPGR